jgi:hypothetical protein
MTIEQLCKTTGKDISQMVVQETCLIHSIVSDNTIELRVTAAVGADGEEWEGERVIKMKLRRL